MKPIEAKIEKLQDITANLAGLLQGIQTVRGIADTEVSGAGLTPETCVTMSKLLQDAELAARQLDTGLKSIHQSMSRYVPPDANEGNKTWPPLP